MLCTLSDKNDPIHKRSSDKYKSPDTPRKGIPLTKIKVEEVKAGMFAEDGLPLAPSYSASCKYMPFDNLSELWNDEMKTCFQCKFSSYISISDT